MFKGLEVQEEIIMVHKETALSKRGFRSMDLSPVARKFTTDLRREKA